MMLLGLNTRHCGKSPELPVGRSAYAISAASLDSTACLRAGFSRMRGVGSNRDSRQP